jgi:N-acetylglucosamine-6-phosphate deacetylase
MQLVGREWDTGEPVSLVIEAGRITRVTGLADGESETSRFDDWPWIAPGLIDVQVNGYGGQEFSSANLTTDGALQTIHAFATFGVTRCCPTLTTESREVLLHALRTLAAACENTPDIAPRIPGIHVEGPYITTEDGARGAHPRRHCRPPDWDEFQQFQEAAGGRVRILTMSPEYANSLDFIRRVTASGVLVAIGHTAASPAQIRAAVDAGARMSTHLGNGAHLWLDQPDNYLWEQLAEDRLTAGIICDGYHLPREVVQTIVRVKTPQRCILVSDLSGQAGQLAGHYSSPFCDIEILDDGRLVMAGQRDLLAGASIPLYAGLVNVIQFAGVSPADAIRMAVHNPADLLGIPPGGLQAGEPANLIQFRRQAAPSDLARDGFQLLCTLFDGQVLAGTPWQSP